VSQKRALSILAIGVIGYAVFAWLFPRFSTLAQWRIGLGEEESIERARAVAAEHGTDVTGWPADAGVRTNGRLSAELRSRADADLSQAVQIQVGFRDPRNAGNAIGVRLDAAGRPNAVVLQREHRPGDDVTVDAARPIAEQAFRRFVPDASSYRIVEQEDLGENGVRFRWERSGADPLVVSRATVIVAGSQIRDIRYGPELSEQGARGNPRSPTSVLDSISKIVITLGVLFGLVLYVMATSRGLVPQRLALTLAAAGWILMLIEMFAELDPKLIAIFDGSNPPARWLLILGLAIFAVPTGLAVAGGYPSARRRFERQLASFEELVLRGRITSRGVGASLLTGIAAGGWIAAVPHLIRATGIFGKYRIADGVADSLFRSGLLPTGTFGALAPVLIAFALLASFVQDKLRGHLGRALAFLLALAVMLNDAVNPFVAALLAALLVTILFDQLFRRVNLLALVAAAASAEWAISAASRLVQPAQSIRADGWTAVSLGAAAGAAAFVVSLWGSLKPYHSWEPRPARAERVRMHAELEVARQAQEQMLPARAPDLPGTSIASFCRPARQVGGDLYDFIAMSDGSLGITVADVSGKGISAALVMTITKGLLLAASDGRSDPLETLADVNAGIHSLGTRSVFVTMLFGVFDPAARTFRFVRAGHTPLVWRKASGEVETLSPRGIGIGMTSPRLFSALCDRCTITTSTGDFLILYSDGVNEAMNERSEEFGDERLLAAVRDQITENMSAEEARVVLVQAVDTFRGSAAAHDDMTLVVVKC
jgi:Serine phosphatase RsbU, regulator of sigma subunit